MRQLDFYTRYSFQIFLPVAVVGVTLLLVTATSLRTALPYLGAGLLTGILMLRAQRLRSDTAQSIASVLFVGSLIVIFPRDQRTSDWQMIGSLFAAFALMIIPLRFGDRKAAKQSAEQGDAAQPTAAVDLKSE